MSVLVVSPADTTDLTTVTSFKEELFGTSSVTQNDDLISRIISECSDLVRSWTGRVYERAQYQELIWGSGEQFLRLSRSPVAQITEIQLGLEGDALDLTDADLNIEIADPDKGRIFSPTDWDPTIRYRVTYRAGFFTSGDDLLTARASANGGTETFDLVSGSLPTHVVARDTTATIALGDFFSTGGSWVNSANVGTFRAISSASSTSITVAENLIQESDNNEDKTFKFRTLPREVERATLQLAKFYFLSRKRNPAYSVLKLGTDTFDMRKSVSKDIWELLSGWAVPGSPLSQMLGEGSHSAGVLETVRA